jgi:hypothetical protein
VGESADKALLHLHGRCWTPEKRKKNAEALDGSGATAWSSRRRGSVEGSSSREDESQGTRASDSLFDVDRVAFASL